MSKEIFEKLYNWEELNSLFEEFLPTLLEKQARIEEQEVRRKISLEVKEEIENFNFPKDPRDSREVTKTLIDKVYPYRMKTNHPRYFCFIPNVVSPYSVFGDIINSIHNPYGGGYDISEGTASLEKETIKWMAEQLGYDVDKAGGQFVSGGSMANLTASVVARDDKLSPEDFPKATAYVSDQTHSSVAKGLHIIGIPRENVRKVETDNRFRMIGSELELAIKKDIDNGYKPFLLVGTSGTTNTGAIDPLNELADIAEKHDLWYHVDGAYGASALLSSHKDLLKGIERSDSISWDGHKWLFQTYGCAAIICKDKMKLVNTYHVNPEYLKDVEAREELNFWDMGIELTKPARGMKLWFTLQTVGLDAMKKAIDQGFIIADWIEEEVSKYDNIEIVSHSHMGIINFRFKDDRYSEEELDEINKRISQKAMEESYSGFLTTILNGKTVLRFCANNPLTTREDIRNIVDRIQKWIGEESK